MDDVSWTKETIIQEMRPVDVSVAYWILTRIDLNTRNNMALIYYDGWADEKSFLNGDTRLTDKCALVDLSEISALPQTLIDIVEKISNKL